MAWETGGLERGRICQDLNLVNGIIFKQLLNVVLAFTDHRLRRLWPGLDPSKFRQQAARQDTGHDSHQGLTGAAEAQRFAACQPLLLPCLGCKQQQKFADVFIDGAHKLRLAHCENGECDVAPQQYLALIVNKLRLEIRTAVRQYLQVRVRVRFGRSGSGSAGQGQVRPVRVRSGRSGSGSACQGVRVRAGQGQDRSGSAGQGQVRPVRIRAGQGQVRPVRVRAGQVQARPVRVRAGQGQARPVRVRVRIGWTCHAPRGVSEKAPVLEPLISLRWDLYQLTAY